jgi:hypothetical protein
MLLTLPSGSYDVRRKADRKRADGVTTGGCDVVEPDALILT